MSIKSGPWAALVAAGITLSGVAAAEEPIVPGEPPTMREVGEIVDVPDAVDEGDPIDIEVVLSYRLDIERAEIIRQNEAGDRELVADYASLTSRLIPEIRIGIWRDLAGFARIPIILSQAGDLSREDATAVTSADGETLFKLPLRFAERSGIEHLSFGLMAGIMNEKRNAGLPNWTVSVEGQVSVGKTLTACNDLPDEGQVRCADPGDIDRDGRVDEGEPDGGTERDPGYTRGTAALVVSTALSKRIGYFEPFGILRAKFEFPLAGSPLEPTSDADGSMLPVRADAEIGIGLVPWENREKFSRVWIDARIVGGLVTRGRDYSAMFDAIGSSDAPSLRSPQEGPSGRVYATGVTTVDTHGSLGASGTFLWRASRLIRLGLGVGVHHRFEHDIVDDPACEDGSSDCATPTNPSYRPVLDDAGGRYRLASALLVQIGVTGALLF